MLQISPSSLNAWSLGERDVNDGGYDEDDKIVPRAHPTRPGRNHIYLIDLCFICHSDVCVFHKDCKKSSKVEIFLVPSITFTFLISVVICSYRSKVWY